MNKISNIYSSESMKEVKNNQVLLDITTIKRCSGFAKKIIHQTLGTNFGSSIAFEKIQRSYKQKVYDHFQGKLAEEAFRLFSLNHGIKDYEIDYNIYNGQNNTDGGSDATISGHSIEVKCSSGRSQWLLVEKNKFRNQDIFVFCKIVDFPTKKDGTDILEQLLERKSIIVEMTGWRNKWEFIRSQYADIPQQKYWFYFGERKGIVSTKHLTELFPYYLKDAEKFMDIKRKLALRYSDNWNLFKADAAGNVGLPIQLLNSNWNQLYKTLNS